jgi:hypothetical protein
VIVSSGKATLLELGTVYSLEAAYDLMEIILVDATNKRLLEEHLAEKAKERD